MNTRLTHIPYIPHNILHILWLMLLVASNIHAEYQQYQYSRVPYSNSGNTTTDNKRPNALPGQCLTAIKLSPKRIFYAYV